jgi:hypothetical protein
VLVRELLMSGISSLSLVVCVAGGEVCVTGKKTRKNRNVCVCRSRSGKIKAVRCRVG